MYPQPGREHYGVFVHEEALALVARGHEVQVIAGIPRTPPLLDRLRPGWRRLATLPAQRTLDGLPIRHPRYLLLPRRLAFAGAGRRLAAAIDPAPLRGQRFDLIHAHAGVPDGAAARRLAAALALPYLITSHGSDVLRAATWSPAVHAELAAAFAGAAALIFPSGVARERARAAGLPVARSHVLWNGYRRELFLAPAPPGPRRGPLHVLCVANLVPSKGVDRLLTAMARLAAAGEAASLTLVGDGPEAGRLQAQAALLGLAPRWLPRLARPELAAAYREADVFALPAAGEAFGIVYLEAMAAGLPVIAPADEGIAELVGHEREGLLLAEPSAEALAAALQRLVRDEPLRARLAAAAHARAATLGWEAHAEALERIYAGALAASGGGPR
jgi:teichuronic acid biosynthesis glycosyltransferase TuaC